MVTWLNRVPSSMPQILAEGCGQSNAHLSKQLQPLRCHLGSSLSASHRQHSTAYGNIYTPLHPISATSLSHRFHCRQYESATTTLC